MYTYYKCIYNICQTFFLSSTSISSKIVYTCFGSAFHTDKMG